MPASADPFTHRHTGDVSTGPVAMNADPAQLTTGLLLAAGAGRRFGGPKALAVGDDGVPWVVAAVQVLLRGGCGDVVVVTGAAAAQVREVLDGAVEDAPVSTITCGTWERGMGESLRAGLMALTSRDRTQQALVHLVDLPDVGPEVIARVLAAGDGSGALARAAYQGIPGHPVLLGRDHWEAATTAARADAGARAYLRRARPHLVECADLATGRDVDSRPGTGSDLPRPAGAERDDT